MFCFGNVTKIFLLLLCYILRIRLWAFVGDLRDFFGFSYRQRKKKISHHPYSTTTTTSQAAVLRRLSQSNSYRRHCPNNLSNAVLQITSSPSIETSSFFFSVRLNTLMHASFHIILDILLETPKLLLIVNDFGGFFNYFRLNHLIFKLEITN